MKPDRRTFLKSLFGGLALMTVAPLKFCGTLTKNPNPYWVTINVPVRTLKHGWTIEQAPDVDDEVLNLLAQEIADQIDADLMEKILKGNEAWYDTVYPGKNQRHKIQVQNEIATIV